MDRRLNNVIFLDQLLSQLALMDDRDKTITCFRLFSRHKSTLDELGRLLNLTRERVRQLEHKLIAKLEPVLGKLRAIYQEEIDESRASVGYICMLNELAPFGERAIEKIGPGEVDFGLLGAKFGLYEVDQGVCFVPDKQRVKRSLLEWAQLQDGHGLFRLDDFPRELLGIAGISNDNLVLCLRMLNLTELSNGQWLQSSNYVDAAAALLAKSSALTQLLELRNQIDSNISIRSFRQRLMADERFAFPDPNQVRLAKDGQTSIRPKSIGTLIAEIVPDGESIVEFNAVVKHVQSQRTVAEASIRAYASRHPFSMEKGLVSRSLQRPKRPRSQPARTRNLFRLPSGWAYRLLVTSEHLRGSSITLPMSFTHAFNLSPDANLYFQDSQSDEPLWMNWDGSQPKARSIRRNLLEIGAQVGDQVMLIFSDSVFSISSIPQSSHSGPEAIAGLFPNLHGLSLDVFLREAFMCSELGGIPLLEAMKLRKEYDLIELFEGHA